MHHHKACFLFLSTFFFFEQASSFVQVENKVQNKTENKNITSQISLSNLDNCTASSNDCRSRNAFSTCLNGRCQCPFQGSRNHEPNPILTHMPCRCTENGHCHLPNSQCVLIRSTELEHISKANKSQQKVVVGYCQCARGFFLNGDENQCAPLPVLAQESSHLLQAAIFVLFPLLSWATLFCLCLRIRKRLPELENGEEEDISRRSVEEADEDDGVERSDLAKICPSGMAAAAADSSSSRHSGDLPPPYSVAVAEGDENSSHVVVYFK